MGIMDMLKNGMPSKGISAEDARRDDLDNKFSQVEKINENSDRESMKGKEGIKKMKVKLLKGIYSEMRRMGVNPGNLDEVSAFMQKLEQIDPDLVTMFEGAMDALDPMKESSGKQAPIQGIGMPPDTTPGGAEPQGMPQQGMPPEGALPIPQQPPQQSPEEVQSLMQGMMRK